MPVVVLSPDSRAAVLEVRRGGVLCPTAAKQLLLLDLATTTRPIWLLEDVPSIGTPAGQRENTLDVWEDIFDAVTSAYSTEASPIEALAPIERKRFARWILAGVDPVVMDAPTEVDASTTTLREEMAAERASAMAERERLRAEMHAAHAEADRVAVRAWGTGGTLATTGGTPSIGSAKATRSTLSSDLAAHPGATDGKQLAYLSKCMVVGRHATRAECAEGQGGYGEHPMSSELLRKSSKTTGIGMMTLSTALDKSRKAKSIRPLEDFLDHTRERMIGCPDDHVEYAALGAQQISEWFNNARRTADNDIVLLEYLEMSIAEQLGRGLPNTYSPQLMDRARKIVRVGDDLPVGSSVPTPSPMAAPPTQAAGVSSDTIAAMSIQLSHIVEALDKSAIASGQMSRRIDGIGSKVDATKSELTTLKGDVSALKSSRSSLTKEEKDKFINCSKCGQKGHRAADCPNGE